MNSTAREDEADIGGMNPLTGLEMLGGAVLLILKSIRHPRRALRRAREIAREIKQDSVG